MDRRQLLFVATACVAFGQTPVIAQAVPDHPARLRKGGCAVMLRHTQTDPGFGDPAGYRLDQCSTQRNLSDEGRTHAKRIGQWFAGQQLRPQSVQSSVWCRCKDTAELAFGTYQVLGALASTFDNPGPQTVQTQQLRDRLKSIANGQFEVWVTHQVNITALTGVVPAMGEAVWVDRKGHVLRRTFFTD